MASQTRKIQKFFDLKIKEVERAERNAMVSFARTTYKVIMREWPVYTGWSKANNRISITGRSIQRLEPQTRPKKEGVLAGKATQVEQNELGKLRKVKTEKLGKTRRIVIGNSVPYAADAGFGADKGRGRRIYIEAVMEAKATVSFKR